MFIFITSSVVIITEVSHLYNINALFFIKISQKSEFSVDNNLTGGILYLVADVQQNEKEVRAWTRYF